MDLSTDASESVGCLSVPIFLAVQLDAQEGESPKAGMGEEGMGIQPQTATVSRITDLSWKPQT
jgi:hypothetical protein